MGCFEIFNEFNVIMLLLIFLIVLYCKNIYLVNCFLLKFVNWIVKKWYEMFDKIDWLICWLFDGFKMMMVFIKYIFLNILY